MVENNGPEADDVWVRKTVQDGHFPDGTTRKLRDGKEEDSMPKTMDGRWMAREEGRKEKQRQKGV